MLYCVFVSVVRGADVRERGLFKKYIHNEYVVKIKKIIIIIYIGTIILRIGTS